MSADQVEISPHAIYSQLLKDEARTPEAFDPIPVGKIPIGSNEYVRLTQSGVTPHQIASGIFRREHLLGTGFVFNNILGNGEKPIIKATIDGMDFGTKRLLTESELVLVTQYQREHPEIFGWQGQDPETVREDMVHFLMVVIYGIPNVTSRTNIFNRSMSELRDQRVPTEFTHRATGERMYRGTSRFDAFATDQWYKHHQPERGHILKTEMGDKFKDVFPWPDRQFMGGPKIREHRAFTMGSRGRALQGMASPFLDSGYYFGGNLDATVEGKKVEGMFRVNSATLHLASRGLSEIGESTTSFDQHYAAIGEYIAELFPIDPKEREELWRMEALAVEGAAQKGEDDVVEDFKRKIIDLSREWINSSQAPLTLRLRAWALSQIKGYKHEPRWVNSRDEPLPIEYP